MPFKDDRFQSKLCLAARALNHVSRRRVDVTCAKIAERITEKVLAAVECSLNGASQSCVKTRIGSWPIASAASALSKFDGRVCNYLNINRSFVDHAFRDANYGDENAYAALLGKLCPSTLIEANTLFTEIFDSLELHEKHAQDSRNSVPLPEGCLWSLAVAWDISFLDSLDRCVRFNDYSTNCEDYRFWAENLSDAFRFPEVSGRYTAEFIARVLEMAVEFSHHSRLSEIATTLGALVDSRSIGLQEITTLVEFAEKMVLDATLTAPEFLHFIDRIAFAIGPQNLKELLESVIDTIKQWIERFDIDNEFAAKNWLFFVVDSLNHCKPTVLFSMLEDEILFGNIIKPLAFSKNSTKRCLAIWMLEHSGENRHGTIDSLDILGHLCDDRQPAVYRSVIFAIVRRSVKCKQARKVFEDHCTVLPRSSVIYTKLMASASELGNHSVDMFSFGSFIGVGVDDDAKHELLQIEARIPSDIDSTWDFSDQSVARDLILRLLEVAASASEHELFHAAAILNIYLRSLAGVNGHIRSILSCAVRRGFDWDSASLRQVLYSDVDAIDADWPEEEIALTLHDDYNIHILNNLFTAYSRGLRCFGSASDGVEHAWDRDLSI